MNTNELVLLTSSLYFKNPEKDNSQLKGKNHCVNQIDKGRFIRQIN